MQFWPCPGCSRHVKRGDATCPFCGATAGAESSPARTLAGRLSRAALFAAGAMGTAVATTACSSTSLPQTMLQPMYGGTSPPDSSSASDAPSTTDGPADAEDASTTSEPTDSSSASQDAPSAVALYGGIAPPYGHVPVPDE